MKKSHRKRLVDMVQGLIDEATEGQRQRIRFLEREVKKLESAEPPPEPEPCGHEEHIEKLRARNRELEKEVHDLTVHLKEIEEILCLNPSGSKTQ